jgi:hypothetical protein
MSAGDATTSAPPPPAASSPALRVDAGVQTEPPTLSPEDERRVAALVRPRTNALKWLFHARTSTSSLSNA